MKIHSIKLVSKMSKNPYTINFSEVERTRYDQFAKRNGYTTLSKLIRASLDVVMRNPALLQPTMSSDSQEMLKTIEESFSAFDQLEERLNKIDVVEKRQNSLENKIDLLLSKHGVTKRELKELDKVNDEEVIFE